MVLKVYPYLNEVLIAIDSPKHILYRAEGNIEESTTKTESYEGIVMVQEGKLRVIEQDKSAPYLTIRKNQEFCAESYDYLRYKTHIQTICRKNDFEYLVINHLPMDETGVLKCFKKVYYALSPSKNKALVHATAVDLAGEGILFVGKKRAGKTTLAFNLIDKLGASLVEGGNSLLSFNDTLRVHYTPRPIFARFSTIATSPYLSFLLNNLDLAEAKQPWDMEAIEEIIKMKTFSVDGGLNFSRRAFRELSGQKTLPSSKITIVVFPVYSETDGLKISSVSLEEAYKRLTGREFKINTLLGKVQDQNNIELPDQSKIRPEWLMGLKIKEISFDGKKDITRSLLEDLVS